MLLYYKQLKTNQGGNTLKDSSKYIGGTILILIAMALLIFYK